MMYYNDFVVNVSDFHSQNCSWCLQTANISDCKMLRCVQVHRVFTKGAASLEGTIQRGDSILSINGISLDGKTHGEAVSCLHQARPSIQALVVIWRDNDSELSPSDRQSASQQRRTCLSSKTSLEAAAGKA